MSAILAGAVAGPIGWIVCYPVRCSASIGTQTAHGAPIPSAPSTSTALVVWVRSSEGFQCAAYARPCRFPRRWVSLRHPCERRRWGRRLAPALLGRGRGGARRLAAADWLTLLVAPSPAPLLFPALGSRATPYQLPSCLPSGLASPPVRFFQPTSLRELAPSTALRRRKAVVDNAVGSGGVPLHPRSSGNGAAPPARQAPC